MGRLQGRITKEDIKEAGFRRWSGRQRVTTDWVNVFYDPELHFPDGDCLIYLREPGQSSHGPAFRVHTSKLRKKGFHALLTKCVTRPALHTSPKCLVGECVGCEGLIQELYIPASHRCGLDTLLDSHITTRNFFAWLYNIPLTGRSLGKSLTDVKTRLDRYRQDEQRNREDIIAYAESQKYLDFRECVDHALASLQLAEQLRLEDLWVDSFCHCVGLSHRGLWDSAEFEYVSDTSKSLLNEASLEIDVRLEKVGHSVGNFFEDELTGSFLGLHQSARDHLDRFRSFLHSFYIEQYGFWPPDKFEQEVVQRLVCGGMYSDFECLYQHLADESSSSADAVVDIVSAGGVCVVQNLRTFDAKHHVASLPRSLPRLPPSTKASKGRVQRRNSWHPFSIRKEAKAERSALRMQSLVDSTNRDWKLMENTLVRRFSEFEVETASDDVATISLIEGRKIRWIVVYAILQTLVSIMQTAKQVRNTEGLSYPLCCRVPDVPWQNEPALMLVEEPASFEPDTKPSHTNTVPTFSRRHSRSSMVDEPTTPSTKAASTIRPSSLRRIMTVRRKSVGPEDFERTVTAAKRQSNSFCEIYVPGYGNGLNEVEIVASPVDTTAEDIDPTDSTPSIASVSRETSNASNSTSRSKASTTSDDTDFTIPTPSDTKALDHLLEIAEDPKKVTAPEHVRILDGTLHFNTLTWDEVLASA